MIMTQHFINRPNVFSFHSRKTYIYKIKKKCSFHSKSDVGLGLFQVVTFSVGFIYVSTKLTNRIVP